MIRTNHTASGDPRRPAILFLHGFMGSGDDWETEISALDECFYCIAPDLPGHGGSVRLPTGAYTMEGAARTVISLLDRLGAENPVVVGYSMGGRLALYLALRHPERCAGVFLESASPGLESAAERSRRRAADEEKAACLETGDFREFLRGWYQQPIFASLARDEKLLRRTIEERLRNDPAELAKSLRGMGIGSQPSLWEEMAGLRVPALTVAGELDGKFVALSRRMVSLNPGIRSVVVPGAGHNVHAEAPAEYLTLLRGFLRRFR